MGIFLSVAATLFINSPLTDKEFDEHVNDVLKSQELTHVDPETCGTSPSRVPNSLASIGVKDNHMPRNYYTVTNEHGQIVEVFSKTIIPQLDGSEKVTADGRYCDEMPEVPGAGKKYHRDRGHIIADSLGGKSNAYNLLPQDSYINRRGEQAELEEIIRDGDGAKDFDMVITYDNDHTNVPASYEVVFKTNGKGHSYRFDNVDDSPTPTVTTPAAPTETESVDVSDIIPTTVAPAQADNNAPVADNNTDDAPDSDVEAQDDEGGNNAGMKFLAGVIVLMCAIVVGGIVIGAKALRHRMW